ncbi:MAG: PQQ-binding-like beta-propeller repeat protein [Calditrichaceae bacterium]
MAKLILKYIYITGISLMIYVVGCHDPVLKYVQPPADKLIFTENVNYQRQNFIAKDFPYPLILIREESINGVTTPFIGLFNDHAVVTTVNGYLSIIPVDDIGDNSKTRLSKGIKAAPTLYGDQLFIPLIEGGAGLKVYNIKTARIAWQQEHNYSESSPIVIDDLAYHANRQGKIYCIKATSGNNIWQNDLNDAINTNLILINQNIAAVSQNGIIQIFDPKSGVVRFTDTIDDPVYAQSISIKDDLFVISFRGKLYKINQSTNTLALVKDFHTKTYTALASDGQRLIISLSSGDIVCMSLPDHIELWRIQTEGPASCPPLMTNNCVIIGTSQRFVYIIEKNNGKIFQTLDLGGRLSAPPVISGINILMAYEYDKIAQFGKAGKENNVPVN